MKYTKNPLTLFNETVFNRDGVNFRFVQKKSKKLGMVVYFKNGKSAESYYNEQGEFCENSHGLAHFIEHLLFSSATENIDWLKKAISEKVEMNGATGEGVVFYHMCSTLDRMLNEYIENLLKISYTLDINEEIFLKEKGIVSTEASLSLDLPNNKTMKLLSKYIKNSHVNHSTVGTPESVNATTMEEVIKYYQDVYTFENSEICIFADFETNKGLDEKIVKLILDKLELIRAKFPIHAQLKGPKRIIARPKNTVLDQSMNIVSTPKVSQELMVRYYRFPLNPETSLLNLEVLNLLPNLLHPMLNANVNELLKEKGLRLDTNFAIDIASSSLEEACFVIQTTQKERLEDTVEYVKELLLNFDKYITDEVIESINISEEEKSFYELDTALTSNLITYPFKYLIGINILDTQRPLNQKVDLDLLTSHEAIRNAVNEMRFDNYIDILEQPETK